MKYNNNKTEELTAIVYDCEEKMYSKNDAKEMTSVLLFKITESEHTINQELRKHIDQEISDLIDTYLKVPGFLGNRKDTEPYPTIEVFFTRTHQNRIDDVEQNQQRFDQLEQDVRVDLPDKIMKLKIEITTHIDEQIFQLQSKSDKQHKLL